MFSILILCNTRFQRTSNNVKCTFMCKCNETVYFPLYKYLEPS